MLTNTTSRLEAFSDGVFAIVITLLALEIRLPEHHDTSLYHALAGLWPILLSYTLSFVVVGLYWMAHQFSFHYIKRSDRGVLWLNILFLMFVALLPFPTAVLGEYGGDQAAALLYGGLLAATSASFTIMWGYATVAGLTEPTVPVALLRLTMRKNLLATALYVAGIVVSFGSVVLAFVVYAIVPLLYVLPGRRAHAEASHAAPISLVA